MPSGTESSCHAILLQISCPFEKILKTSKQVRINKRSSKLEVIEDPISPQL